MKKKEIFNNLLIRLLITVLMGSALLAVFSQSAGDVNGDGTSNTVDTLMITQYYSGLDPAGFNANAVDALQIA